MGMTMSCVDRSSRQKPGDNTMIGESGGQLSSCPAVEIDETRAAS